MISARLIYHECQRRGVRLAIERGTLRVSGPASAIDTGLSEALEFHAEALASFLARESNSGAESSPHTPRPSPHLVHTIEACGLGENASNQALNPVSSPHSPHEYRDRDSRIRDFQFPEDTRSETGENSQGEINSRVRIACAPTECGLGGLDSPQVFTGSQKPPSPQPDFEWTRRGLDPASCGLGDGPEGDPHEFEERAAVIENEADGMPRDLAERSASAVARGGGVFRNRPENSSSLEITIPRNWRKWAEWLPLDIWREWRRLAAQLTPSVGTTIEQVEDGDRDALMVTLDEHPELELWRVVDARV